MSGPEKGPERGLETGPEKGPEDGPVDEQPEEGTVDDAPEIDEIIELVTQQHVLERFPEQVAVVRLGPGAEVPSWAESSSIFSVTATATETSIVCAKRSVPAKARQAGPFTAYAVRGPLDFALTGVLASLLVPLAAAQVSVFTLSTFDTDWLLVPRDAAEAAEQAWSDAGHRVEVAQPVTPAQQRAQERAQEKSQERDQDKPHRKGEQQ